MQTSDDLAELARICAGNARTTNSKEAAATLWKMAQKYQQRAADLDSGRLPDIGPPPPLLTK